MAVGLSVCLLAHPDPRGEDVSLWLVLPLHLVVQLTPYLTHPAPFQGGLLLE